MLDAKRALEESDGDMKQAAQWLREKGLAGAAKRDDREASEGAVAVVRDGNVAAIVQLRSETDFVAKAPEFVAFADELAALVVAKGEAAVAERQDEVDRLRSTLQENISVGQVVRIEAGPGEVLDTYLHQQAGRGVNAVIVLLAQRHDRAGPRHRPPHRLRPAGVPPPGGRAGGRGGRGAGDDRGDQPERGQAGGRAAKRSSRVGSVAGSRTAVLLDQSFARDEKQSIAGMLGSAEVVRFVQVVIGS